VFESGFSGGKSDLLEKIAERRVEAIEGTLGAS
jgi:hypothetical protein